MKVERVTESRVVGVTITLDKDEVFRLSESLNRVLNFYVDKEHAGGYVAVGNDHLGLNAKLREIAREFN